MNFLFPDKPRTMFFEAGMFPMGVAVFPGIPVMASVILRWRIVTLVWVEPLENS